MKNTIVSLLIILLSFSCWSQAVFKNRLIKNDTDLLHATTWIIGDNIKDDGVPITGTGYFFLFKDTLYLITNWHIVKTSRMLAFDVQWSEKKSSLGIDFINTNYKKFDRDKNDRTTTDLVAIPISNIPTIDMNEFPRWKAFGVENVPTVNEIKTFRLFDEKVISFSYPGGLVYPYLSAPIIFHCNLASNYSALFMREKEFCINGDMREGCSGSPIVLIKPNNKYFLLGTIRHLFQEASTIDSVEFRDTNKNWVYSPKVPFKVEAKENKFSEYRVLQSRNLSIAIKSEKLLELFK